jgi:hypothetical protein
LFAQIESSAKADGRSVSNFLEQVVSNYMTHPRPVKLEVRSRPEGQMHIEDAIAAAVKRGPVRASKHK